MRRPGPFMRPSVNIAVCGNFGQLQLMPELARIADLNRVYYAARTSSDAASLGLRPEQACNLFVKEYLIQAHVRFLRHTMGNVFYPLYDKIWQRGVHRNWTPCDVLHAVATGATLPIIRRARDEGAAILTHPVSSHPEFYREELDREIAHLGVPQSAMVYPDRDIGEELRLSNRMFCLSTLVRDSLVARGYSADRIDVIPLPTDLDLFSPGSSPPAGLFRVTCVADVRPIKGHIYLLEAWRKLRLPNAELVFAGTMRREMAGVLDRYRGLFRYVGPLGKRALVDLYRQSTLMVLPSLEDGFGLVVAEALACGTPVLITEQVGARDIVKPGVNGYVVPTRDVEALAQTMSNIHASASLREQLRQGAIATRATYPTVQQTAEALARAYEKTATDRNRT
jgi:glycosyltransferase involved in cell wall biosynthesis